MIDKLPKAFRNFYVICGVLFLILMILDSNNLIVRFSLTSKLNSLENEKAYYMEKIEEVEKDREELFGNKETLEKFAREKYFMKKETEDVFVIVEE